MADVLDVVVLFLHILFAVLWIGGMGFAVIVLGRVVPRLGMPVGRQFSRQFIPVALRFVPISAVLTVAFGAILYLLLGNLDPANLWGTNWGLGMLSSLILSLALFAFGILVVTRASRKILAHLNEDACSHGPEVGRLQKSLNLGQVTALGWGVFLLALMVAITELQ